MVRLDLLDTYLAFERYWREVRSEDVEVQIERWENEYMADWPELLAKLKKSYSDEGVDWRTVARTRVFPHLEERLPRLRQMHRNLLKVLPQSWSDARRKLELDFPVRFVVYVGIGVGAGWATTYRGQPACLFGLENAAEMSAGESGFYPASVSHELAHVAHDHWRKQKGLRGVDQPRGPYWQLYSEGFATECERRIDDPRAFRLRTGRPDWLAWCERHRSWLARKFLRDVASHRSTRPYFGSWFDVRGQVESGYYLGAEMIRGWTDTRSLREIAVLPEPEARRLSRSALRVMAHASTRS
jgi:hypothetical protein